MEQERRKAWRAEYMRNYRKMRKERETAEEAIVRRAAEAQRIRALRQLRNVQETNEETKIRRAAEAQRIRSVRHFQKQQRKTTEDHFESCIEWFQKFRDSGQFNTKVENNKRKYLQPCVEENEIKDSSNFINEDEELYYTSAVPSSKVLKSSLTAVDEACTALKNKWENDDHFSIFGEYVASRIRNLNNPRLQSIGQHRINTIIFELEMEATSQWDLESDSVPSSSQCLKPNSTTPNPQTTFKIPDFFISSLKRKINYKSSGSTLQFVEPISPPPSQQSNNDSLITTSETVTPDSFIINIKKEINDECEY